MVAYSLPKLLVINVENQSHLMVVMTDMVAVMIDVMIAVMTGGMTAAMIVAMTEVVMTDVMIVTMIVTVMMIVIVTVKNKYQLKKIRLKKCFWLLKKNS